MPNMTKEKNRKIVLGIGIVVAFLLLLLVLNSYVGYRAAERRNTWLEGEMRQNLTAEQFSHFEAGKRMERPSQFTSLFLLVPALLGVFVGVLVYYVTSEKIVEKEHQIEKNTKIILNFLGPEEKKIVHTLLANGGSINQYELTRLPDLNKVKTHRILQKLEQKGVITKQHLGKINKIALHKELYEVLKD
ncbi:MAG: hypothetical protein ABH829_02740 [archaeon]